MQAPDTGPHAEQLSAQEAYALLRSDRAAQLIDVRTKPEWNFVGTPDLGDLDKSPILLEWQSWPSMTVETDFVAAVERKLANLSLDRGATLLFLCRSGVRSDAAARACLAAGFSRCVNIVGGFEGPPDPQRHRGSVSGWKADGLPWAQT